MAYRHGLSPLPIRSFFRPTEKCLRDQPERQPISHTRPPVWRSRKGDMIFYVRRML